MLFEIKAVQQEAGAGTKRWFRDEVFDLYLWEGKEGVTSMQLCYNRAHDEHVLSWSAQDGYSHNRIDAPEDKPGRAMTAIFKADGAFPADQVLATFTEAAATLPQEVVQFVAAKIAAYQPATPGHPGETGNR